LRLRLIAGTADKTYFAAAGPSNGIAVIKTASKGGTGGTLHRRKHAGSRLPLPFGTVPLTSAAGGGRVDLVVDEIATPLWGSLPSVAGPGIDSPSAGARALPFFPSEPISAYAPFPLVDVRVDIDAGVALPMSDGSNPR